MSDNSNKVLETINSEGYWNNRFESNWEDLGGSEQTRFFGEIASKLIPDWLIRKIRLYQYHICDIGCALGEAADFLSKFLNVSVDGMDFSETAITEARKRFPHLNFYRFDLTKDVLTEPYNVVYCSNVLEHFATPWKIFKKLAEISSDYIIVQIPFCETLEIDEHLYRFEASNIPVYLENFFLVYGNVVDGKKIDGTLYPDKQILLIYSKHKEDLQVTYLADTVSKLIEMETAQIHDLELDLQSVNSQMEQYKKAYEQMQEKTTLLENELEEKMRQNERQAEQYKKAYEQMQEKTTLLENKLEEKTKQNERVQSELNTRLTELNEVKLIAQNESVNYEEVLSQKQLLENHYNDTKEELWNLQARIECAQKEIVHLSESKVYKFAHLLYRIKYQAFAKSKEERKQFRRWMSSKVKSSIGDSDHRYNPLFRIMEHLEARERTQNVNRNEVLAKKKENDKINIPQNLQHELKKEYKQFDVIVFSVIDYDFRYQRPQQIADHFAQKGHRVFYIDADFIAGDSLSVTEKKKNLHIVKLPNSIHPSVYSTNFTDAGVDIQKTLDSLLYKYGIRDALIIADYPTWISGMEYLKNSYGFPIITDYMDDFTGFDNAQDAFIEEACKRLLTVSDYVVASSQYLMDIAKQYNQKVEPIRNGTEFEHFHKAYQKNPIKKERKIVGYYGAIAHWFAFEKVEYLAKNLPEVDFVLIGSVTETNHNLEKYSNVKLLGEKPYKELPQYLQEFDVCLIPFDTSTNLIKATNPVKFYEYLSAGKKIVATEIPELMPFENQYVYLTNDNEEFLNKVKICLDGKDDLSDSEACFEFAKMNDWSNRVTRFAETANAIFPKVSIVVLCYNQLDYTKECVESILKNTAYPNYELILVDNNSTDDTAQYIQDLSELEEKVKIVLNKTNRGFAGGNNDGINIAEGDYIVLLNNDTVVTRGWLSNLVKRFAENPKLGITGPVTNSIGNEAKIDVPYEHIEDMHAFAYWYTHKHMNQVYPKVNVLAMFCVMIRKSMMDEIGLLDENYGVGMFEDDDYSMAAKRGGYDINLVEDVFVHHYGSVSFKKLEDEKFRKIFEDNKKYYEEKWNTTWTRHQYRK